jgi:uncharacterized protein YjiS (DUF1127 family)
MTRILRDLRDRYLMHVKYQSTVRELTQLTDRDLSDLGITRSCIESVARESVASRIAARRAA